MTPMPRDAAEDRPIEATPVLDGESFGTWLRRQREGREIELRTIAETSKISLRYLQALESDRFDVLPAPVFAKGFLRQYAGFVGLDPEEVVNFFMAARRSAEQDAGPDLAAPVPRRRGTAWIFVAGAAVLAAVLVLVIAWMARLSDASRDASQERAPEESMPRPATPRPEPPLAPAPPTPALPALPPPVTEIVPAPPARPVSVTLDFIGNCWVEVWLDGVATVAEMRVQGESLQLGAERLVEVKLGDPSMVQAEVNGRPFPIPVTGAVVRLRIDLETVRALAAGGLSDPGAGER